MGVTRTDWKVCCLHYLSLRWVEMSWQQRQPGINSSLSVDQKPGKKVKRGKNKREEKVKSSQKASEAKTERYNGLFLPFFFPFQIFHSFAFYVYTFWLPNVCIFCALLGIHVYFPYTPAKLWEKCILLSGAWYIYIHHEKFILTHYSKALSSSHKLLVNKFWTQLNHPQYCGPSWLISDMLGTIVSSPTIWAQLTPPQ